MSELYPTPVNPLVPRFIFDYKIHSKESDQVSAIEYAAGDFLRDQSFAGEKGEVTFHESAAGDRYRWVTVRQTTERYSYIDAEAEKAARQALLEAKLTAQGLHLTVERGFRGASAHDMEQAA